MVAQKGGVLSLNQNRVVLYRRLLEITGWERLLSKVNQGYVIFILFFYVSHVCCLPLNCSDFCKQGLTVVDNFCRVQYLFL